MPDNILQLTPHHPDPHNCADAGRFLLAELARSRRISTGGCMGGNSSGKDFVTCFSTTDARQHCHPHACSASGPTGQSSSRVKQVAFIKKEIILIMEEEGEEALVGTTRETQMLRRRRLGWGPQSRIDDLHLQPLHHTDTVNQTGS